MKTQTNSIAWSPVTRLPCLPGQLVRLVSISAAMTGLAQGARLVATICQPGAAGIVAFTGPTTSDTVNASLFLGADLTQPLLDTTTVATGVANYDIDDGFVSGPLPEVWWEFEVNVLCQVVGGGNVVSGTLTYQTLTEGRVREKKKRPD